MPLPKNLVDDMMKNISDSYNMGFIEMFPMGAIYIYALKGKVYKGDKVLIEGENIIKATTAPTHEITGLFGTLAGNKLQIEVRNLSNNETKIIEL